MLVSSFSVVSKITLFHVQIISRLCLDLMFFVRIFIYCLRFKKLPIICIEYAVVIFIIFVNSKMCLCGSIKNFFGLHYVIH